MSTEPVVIIGAGWAGLAAAVTLTSRGQKVIVYEAAKQVGGRARSVPFADTIVDNGQHLMIGAYQECIKILKLVGQCPYAKMKRTPLFLAVQDETGQQVEVKAPRLPAPFHLLYALITAKGLSIKDRFAAVQFGLFVKKNHYQFSQDISVKQLFDQSRQTDNIIKQLWEPLCLSTLNTPIEIASANVFMRVFKDAFTHHYYDADLLLPIIDLSEIFPNAAVQYIRNKGGEVHLQSRLEKIHIENDKIKAIDIKNDTQVQTVTTSSLILAVAPQNLNKLISATLQLNTLQLNTLQSNTLQSNTPRLKTLQLKTLQNIIDQFSYQPIVTVYLQYTPETRLNHAMQGLSGTISQWVFDRGQLCQQHGLFSVVISCEGSHMQMDEKTLIQTVQSEVSALFDQSPELQNAFVVREKRATYACTVNINTIRPTNRTDVNGLYLAGDYTDTGYPATLEGAVRSGLTAANQI